MEYGEAATVRDITTVLADRLGIQPDTAQGLTLQLIDVQRAYSCQA